MNVFAKSLVLIMLILLSLEAKPCQTYDEAYALAELRMQEESAKSYRKNYDLINELIDTATAYLAYCKKEITLAEQYQLQQRIKKADKMRRTYFEGAVREYHVKYGIRPNVREIYQDGGGYSSGGGRNSGYSSPPRFPAVRQPQ